MSIQGELDAVLARVDADLPASLERLFALLRIPSISTDPAYAGDCRRAATWLADDLKILGLAATAHSTCGHPIVLGSQAERAGPHVLFYGHYDVQPVDPLDLWQVSPFEPVLQDWPDGRRVIVGRGASDDKGQLMTFIEACRAWTAVTGTTPVRVSVLLEGEEEAGGASLPPFLDTHRDALGEADIALVCDTGMWDRTTPSVTTMLRGIISEEIAITAASRDLHSGGYGNAARNPNQVLAEIIASLRAADGSVAIAGFYDQVEDVPEAIKQQWADLGFDETAYLSEVGLGEPAGEVGRSVLEMLWARPSCEINGMSGGYTGEVFKTVIPSQARAKISFRLVAGQEPEVIRAAFRQHVIARLPQDCSVAFHAHGGAGAISTPLSNPLLKEAIKGLSQEWGKPAVLMGSGGSIPVVGEFKRKLGLDSLLIGFAHNDDQIHSPNEKYDLESFHRGIRSWVRILAQLAQAPLQ